MPVRQPALSNPGRLRASNLMMALRSREVPITPLAWLCAVAAALCLSACGSTVTQTEKPWGPTYHATPQRLAPAARRAINHTLDVFVRSGVERQSPALALTVASPVMRSSATRAEWLAGNLPVAPFQVAGSNFHGYTVVTASPNQANLTLILQAKDPKTESAIAYSVRLSRIHGKWLLDWFTPTAFFAPASKTPSITAEPDLAPGAASSLQPKSHGALIFEAVFALLLLPAFVVIGIIVVHIMRERRRPALSADDERWATAFRPSADKQTAARS